MRWNLCFGALAICVYAFSFSPVASAQNIKPQPGDACTQAGTFAANYLSPAGAENDGNLLVCDGANWVTFGEYATAGTMRFRLLTVSK